MTNNRLLFTSFSVLLLGWGSVANAGLVPRLGGQAVYDTDLDITWVADANLARSNTFGVASISQFPGPASTPGIRPDGSMNWATANNWIAGVNSANYLGFSDWRLPDTNPSCQSFNCTNSEMGHLYYTEFGISAGPNGVPITNGNPVELAKFTNIDQINWYWSGTEMVSTGEAWLFGTHSGFQRTANKSNWAQALAVRSGDIGGSGGGANGVPAPAGMWLLGIGSVGLMGAVRRRRRKHQT